jgi:hypothetical protein
VSKNRQSWEVITVIGSEANKVEPYPFEYYLLQKMKFRVRQGRPPLPEGFVPPPGVDIEALLKQVPWPPPTS